MAHTEVFGTWSQTGCVAEDPNPGLGAAELFLRSLTVPPPTREIRQKYNY